MANVQRYGGLVLKDAVGGAGQGVEIAIVPAADTHPTGRGDPLQLYAGDFAVIGGGEKVALLAQGTATSAIYGVCMSALPHYNDGTASMDLTKVYRPASTAMYVLIRVGNVQDVYEISDDGVTAGLTSGHGTYNYKFIAADCDTNYGLSKFSIDSANGGTTATYPMKVIGPSHDVSNDPASAYARWRVNLNNVIRAGGTGTAGV